VTIVVSQGTGGRILLKTEQSLIDKFVRTLKKSFPSPLVEVKTVDIV
jgi:fatty acid/phospholipid biosynthesis enzyme